MIEKNPSVNTNDSLDKMQRVSTLDKLLMNLKTLLFFSVADAKDRAVQVQQMNVLRKRVHKEGIGSIVSSPTEYTPLLGIHHP